MMRRKVVHIPDELWKQFGKEIDHFEYGDGTSVAVYFDGRRIEFDSRVTEEREKEERERHPPSGTVLFSAKFSTQVDRSNWKPVVVGVVE